MAITEPAKKAGSQVEDDLVHVLLTEVRTHQPGTSGAGMLPLLSHALDQAWRSRSGQSVTLADYERTGGIEGAVAGSAQRAYERLTPGRQAAARQVFTRLTATSAEGVDYAVRIGADPARHPPLGQTERDFLHASSHAHRRTVRRRQAVIAGLLALTLTALAAAGIAVRNAATAARDAANAE